MVRRAVRLRGLIAALGTAVVLAAAAMPAGAAVPRSELLAGQIGQLESGTAILHYDSARARGRAAFARQLRRTGARTVFFDGLRLVAVRGSAAELRRAAGLRGIRSAHMDSRLQLLLHESVPLVYGGSHDAVWATGADGRGGSVAVVDSGVDGLHPALVNRMSANVKVADPGSIFDAGEPVFVECPTACNTDGTGGHGTHVAGTVAGDGGGSNGFYRGVAPGARIVGLSVGEAVSVLYALAAFEWIIDNHREHRIVAVNNSWGPIGASVRYDSSHPINVATRAIDRAGMVVVFAAGNGGSGSREDPPGASDCSTQASPDGGREATDGACVINPYSVAPWAISVANARKDEPGGAAGQHLSFSSSRGDPVQQLSLDGVPVAYLPTLTAPGTNIRAARGSAGTTTPIACLVAEVPACVPPAGAEAYEPFHMPLTGTSMAAPHVAGAVAVLQSAARARLGRRLTPGEVRRLLVASATPMTGTDGLWDWPCGSLPIFVECGRAVSGTTGAAYERYHVGGGYLNVAGAVERVRSLRRGGGRGPR